MIRPPRTSPLFPYTTLFRSDGIAPGDRPPALRQAAGEVRPDGQGPGEDRPHHRRGDRHRRRAASDRKSTRLNSSHMSISYAVFCLKKKKIKSAGRGRTETKT